MSDPVEKIVDLVARSRVRSIKIRTPDCSITVSVKRRRTAVEAEAPPSVAPDSRAAPTPVHPVQELQTVRSRRVGVFHHLEPPVVLGQTVAAGQTLGVIESMRILSDVRAERAGAVNEILIEDGAPVEYDQPLFVLAVQPSVREDNGDAG